MVMSVLLHFYTLNWKKKKAFWTFINVHFLDPKGSLENPPIFSTCEHNALKFKFFKEKSVTINFKKTTSFSPCFFFVSKY